MSRTARDLVPTLAGMSESASETPAEPPVVWDEPIARVVIEEVAQLLGHDPADVVRVIIEPMFALVQVVNREDRERPITHRHSIL